MMIKRFAMATALLLAASVASAHVPNIFVAGQPAKAQEINENFEHLLLEHSNYGVGGSTDGAGGATAGTADGVDVGGTTAGTDARRHHNRWRRSYWGRRPILLRLCRGWCFKKCRCN